VQFYGTDLGYTFLHDSELRILFGDTLISDTARPPLNEHALGELPFALPRSAQQLSFIVVTLGGRLRR
jgi:hypothetical protein